MDGGEGENESDAFMGIRVHGGLGCKVLFFFSKSFSKERSPKVCDRG